MFPKKDFPLQQGDLDSLCAVYAVLNCLKLVERLHCAVQAEELFHRVVAKITSEGGNLEAAVTKGFDPVHEKDRRWSDINWIAATVHEPEFISAAIPHKSYDQFCHEIESSHCGAIVFFCAKDDPDKTHYTVVRKNSSAGAYPLYDSYGFRELTVGGGSAHIDGHEVSILYVWPTQAI